MEESHNCCYICLHEGPLSATQPLSKLCRCPNRLSHPVCLARWQLHSAGKEEERVCRFCKTSLQDWKISLSEALEKPDHNKPVLEAYMRISYNGISHKVKVKPGSEGSRQFVEDCQKLLGIPKSVDFDVVFHCKEPVSGNDVSFRSLSAFDAAVACAALGGPAHDKSQESYPRDVHYSLHNSDQNISRQLELDSNTPQTEEEPLQYQAWSSQGRRPTRIKNALRSAMQCVWG